MDGASAARCWRCVLDPGVLLSLGMLLSLALKYPSSREHPPILALRPHIPAKIAEMSKKGGNNSSADGTMENVKPAGSGAVVPHLQAALYFPLAGGFGILLVCGSLLLNWGVFPWIRCLVIKTGSERVESS